MRILHTADWHIGNYPGPEQDGVNLRGADIGLCINHIRDMALLREPDLMVISGDLFHQARVWSDRGLREVKVAIRALEVISESCVILVLRGTPNHDGEEQFALLEAHFNGNSRVYIISQPGIYTCWSQKGEQVSVAALPGFDKGYFRSKFPGLSKEEEDQVFTSELGKIVLGLRAKCKDDAPAILISHYTVPGCVTESGQVPFLAQFEPVLAPEVLDAAGFDLIALGHIHKPQQVIACKNTYYSGAINQLTFNDEGQQRGFLIHDLDRDTHAFYPTPYRAFATYRLMDEDIAKILTGKMDQVAASHWAEGNGCQGKIVRVLYSCSEDQNKAFNKALLEQRLYADGAFWVSEISPEQMVEVANKNDLSDKADPVVNLQNYLSEKDYSQVVIAEVVEVAMPLIAQALSGEKTAGLHGAFLPIEIEVKNYRNYVAETFDFSQISFCTINGKNGSGKSSLFMDAILDCLYEEPREGDLTGWIRSDEEARSGSIRLTFSIGEQVFRVVRTRAKSGKATLNLGELIGDEWANRSKEKIKDTQDEIIHILGMDSLTFRSCALIMQDQYGLFLQADKESRMAILGSLLGLGIYETMEGLAKNKVTDLNRALNSHDDRLKQLSEAIKPGDHLAADLSMAQDKIAQSRGKLTQLNAQRDKVNVDLSNKQEAMLRADKIAGNIKGLKAKQSRLEEQIENQKAIIQKAEQMLGQEAMIKEHLDSYQTLLAKEKALLGSQATYEIKTKEADQVAREIAGLIGLLANQQLMANRLEEEKVPLEVALSQEEQLKAQARQYALANEHYEQMIAQANRYHELQDALSGKQRTYLEAKSDHALEAHRRKTVLEGYQGKLALLDDSGCLDVGQATCKFLADAQKAKLDLEPFRTQSNRWREDSLLVLADLAQEITEEEKRIEALGYDHEATTKQKNLVDSLSGSHKAYEALSGKRVALEQLGIRCQESAQVTSNYQGQLMALEEKQSALVEELATLEESARDYVKVTKELQEEKIWLEIANGLPVAKEQQTTALLRLMELDQEKISCIKDLKELEEALINEQALTQGAEALAVTLRDINRQLDLKNQEISTIQVQIGSLNRQLEVIKQQRLDMVDLQYLIKSLAKEVNQYGILKKAFSQDGIPHYIIRSIIPQLTAIANNILGQMTGGKMGMDFKTEKVLKSNSKKEVVTLDIFIEEYGKGALPYLSKSGGEKVKASLSAILALAEIKSTQAGIQLGMLFIDEPPFLDSDGIQAYCDALETIRKRYSKIKVMAITHDPTMKARFPQSVDVIKTDKGSKVVLN